MRCALCKNDEIFYFGRFFIYFDAKKVIRGRKGHTKHPINLCLVAKFDDKMTTAGAVFAEIVSAKVKQTQQTTQFYR